MKKRVLEIISWLALAGTILPSFIYLFGDITLDRVKLIMLVATVAWFVATPLWMKHKLSD